MNEAVAPVAQAVAARSASGFAEESASSPRSGDAPRCGTNGSGSLSSPASRASITATSAATAANESWKADAENGLRLDRDDGEDREGEIAHGQRPPVQDHRAEHDQRHDEGALGANARTGRDVVEERGRHRDHGRPFLDRIFQRQRRRQREQAPGDDEKNAGDQRHLHAGNRDDVEDAGLANEVLGVVGEKVAFARDHRGGDRALIAADDGVHPERQPVARLVDGGAKRWLQVASLGGGKRRIGPSVEPTAPTPAKNASRAKS